MPKTTEFRPRPFNPETDTRACLMHESSKGRILSQAVGIPGAAKTQYAPACKPNGGLPSKSGEFQLTMDARLVSCPKCQQTSEFLAKFSHQTGLIFDLKKIEAGEPLDDAPESTEEDPT